MEVVGIDGTRRGWVAVVLRHGAFAEAAVASTVEELTGRYASAACVGVDIPIGTLEAGFRDADMAARAFLGRRAASIFMTPPRAAIEASSYTEALDEARRVTGKGISKQAYALALRVVEVGRVAARDARLYEVHPEVSFKLLAGRDLEHSKKTWGGQADRRALLGGAGIGLPDRLGAADCVPAHDVLDAAVAAWSAQRIAEGRARTFPGAPRQRAADGGRLIAIWA
jgi:predicted RNase H-like nuclease